MRPAIALAVALTLTCALTAADPLDASRAAVAGTRPPIHALKMAGRLRTATTGDQTIDGTVEIRIQLPRRFVRIDTIDATRRVTGIDGGRLLSPARVRGRDQVGEHRAELARLMLGIAAIVVGDEPIRIEPAADEAFADTRSLDLTSRSWSLRFVMDAATSMPMRLVFFGRGRGTTITSFADRRDVAGYQIPHRITTTTADRVLETLMFDEASVNPPLTEADFRP